jgi:hypothetical protein
MEPDVPPKHRALSDLHSVTNQRAVLFIVTAVRTSNSILLYYFRFYNISKLVRSSIMDRN